MHKRERCHLKRQGQAAPTCGVLEGNKVFGREHHPMLHLSKSNYFLATTLLTSATPRPTYTKRSLNQADLGRPTTLGRRLVSLFAILKVPIKAMGRARSSIAFMMEDNGSTENFVIDDLAKELNLAQTPATVLNTMVGGANKHQDTYEYLLKVWDARGVCHPVKVFALDSITNIEQMEGVVALE